MSYYAYLACCAVLVASILLALFDAISGWWVVGPTVAIAGFWAYSLWERWKRGI